MLKKLLSKPCYILFSAFVMMNANPAFAAGLAKTKSWLTQFSTELHSLAAVAFLIAGYLVGYVVMYRGQPFESVSKLVYGCLIFMIVPEVSLWVFG